MSQFVSEHKPNLMFIHFDSIDEAGHSFSWEVLDTIMLLRYETHSNNYVKGPSLV